MKTTIRETIALLLIIAAPALLITGIAHTAAHNSPGIILGVAGALIAAALATLIAE